MVGVKQYINISVYSYYIAIFTTAIRYNMAKREYQYIAYCNILQYIARYNCNCARYCVVFNRLKNKMTNKINKCIKVIISACL